MGLSNLSFSFPSALNNQLTNTSPGGSSDKSTAANGTNSFPDLSVTFTFGTGAAAGNQCYCAQRTVSAGANDDIDLSGALTDPFGNSIAFTKVRFFLIAIVSPDGTKVLRVGPQAVANAWAAPFGGVGATVYRNVYTWDVIQNPYAAGYAVSGGATDVIRVNNPTGSSITYQVLAIGE